MSNEKHEMGGSDSLYDLGGEKFTLDKELEAGRTFKSLVWCQTFWHKLIFSGAITEYRAIFF